MNAAEAAAMASSPPLIWYPASSRAFTITAACWIAARASAARPFSLPRSTRGASDHCSNCCLFVIDRHEATSFGRQHEKDDDRQRDNAQTDEMIVCPCHVVVAHDRPSPRDVTSY